MPAGDQVTADGQLELRATLMGATTNVGIDYERGGIHGLLTNPAKAAESEYAHKAGSFMGEVYRASRTATFNLLIRHQSAVDAGVLFESMLDLWDPESAAASPEPLYFRLWGFGKRYVNGRAMGVVDADLSELSNGTVPFAALFRITDPVIRT